MIAILISMLLIADDGQRGQPVMDFEQVTSDYDGQWVTVRLTLNTAEDDIDRNTFYGCASEDEISRSVCFQGMVNLNEKVTHLVKGRLRVIHHELMIADGEVYHAFTEYRLERAVKLVE